MRISYFFSVSYSSIDTKVIAAKDERRGLQNEYFSKYADNFRVKVSKLANTDYDCKIKQDKSFEYIFKISCAINKNISEGEILKLTLENLPNETEFSDITIRRKEYTVPMKAFITCPENFTYNIGSYKLFI